MASILRAPIDMLTKKTSTEKRLIFVGAKKSGKTTALGCLSLSCDLLSLEQGESFSHYIDEKSSGICQVPSDLCQGLFPEETPPGSIYEAQIHIKDKHTLRERHVNVPVCETAGEDMETLTGPYTESVYRQKADWASSDTLNRYICDSHGYIVSLPVSEANIPWVPDEFRDTHDEPQDQQGHFVDPDLTLKRILSSIFAWKERNKDTSPEVEGIAILLTKADKIMKFVKGHGMNLNTELGQQNFLRTYFRQTTSVLKYYGLQRVKFFPVFVEVEKVKTPEGKIVIKRWPNGAPKIALDVEKNLPLFSVNVYKDLIRWALQTFG